MNMGTSVRRTCDCMCGLVHPQAKGICELREPVTFRKFLNKALEQVVEVPFCQPCADELDRLRAEFGKPPIRKESAT